MGGAFAGGASGSPLGSPVSVAVGVETFGGGGMSSRLAVAVVAAARVPAGVILVTVRLRLVVTSSTGFVDNFVLANFFFPLIFLGEVLCLPVLTSVLFPADEASGTDINGVNVGCVNFGSPDTAVPPVRLRLCLRNCASGVDSSPNPKACNSLVFILWWNGGGEFGSVYAQGKGRV